MDIIIPASNPENGDVDYFKSIPVNGEDCFFRGKRLDIKKGDKIFVYADKSIQGWIEFVRYDFYGGKNLQQQTVHKPDALWVRGPFHAFNPPLPTPPDE